MSHVAVTVGVLSEKYKIRPFYLPPYHTSAAMLLDAAPNREMARAWSAMRAKNFILIPITSKVAQTLLLLAKCVVKRHFDIPTQRMFYLYTNIYHKSQPFMQVDMPVAWSISSWDA